ncbi:CBS domain-containing protein [Elioraea tepida]|uniref:CBS domain-containing protein n=1 Tax=Elioraea tepida TaxID=2843330 RepID=A0A975U0J7_9PROT|nr:CBS domain-containing protein [Elioraea tepida]QXM24121.1 CBS domain-containing protein [Elioraea tepida]
MSVAAILEQKGQEIFSARPDDTLEAITRLLSRHNIGAVLIRDATDAVLGILSERDIIRAIATHGAAALLLTASAVMTRDIIYGSPCDTVDKVLATMTERRIRHLPVVEEGKLIGIVSIGDVVKRRIADVEEEADQLRQFVAGNA